MATGRPDWFGTIVAAGKYDTTFLPIALDKDGYITATMKGLYDSLLKTIAVDENSVMKANISVQDLEELIMRPKYGAAQREFNEVSVGAGATEPLISLSKRGIIYRGHIWCSPDISCRQNTIYFILDGKTIADCTLSALNYYSFLGEEGDVMQVAYYDDVNYSYSNEIGGGYTFETSVLVQYKNAGASAIDVSYELVYATI